MSTNLLVENDQLKDLVCEMAVSTDSEYSYAYADKQYFFCSDHCLHKFKEHPEQYVDKKTSPPPESGTSAIYTCPMPPEIQQPGSGSCPKCGMALEPMGVPVSATKTTYTCPMHPEVVQDHPGNCPKCGMVLESATFSGEEKNEELIDMSQRFWVSTFLALPVFFLAMIADHAIKTLAGLPGTHLVWAVGERVKTRLEDAGLLLSGLFAVPNFVRSITPLIAQILMASESQRTSSATFMTAQEASAELHLFCNVPTPGAVYEPRHQRLLPLDLKWQRELVGRSWPTKILPEVMGDSIETVRSLISKYLFVSLFRACAESLASENASRLAAMQRADKNIDELLEDLGGTFHRLRQSGIDEELFDVLSGFETLGGSQ